ncbi:LytTR family DNA-binding domain-containing protein [Afipia sp. GAS231]|uniref:LytTR family DNA-binding domain-containing protein n=1 Tax=Afipia sp. GAS231 TaxID=1882747 RepID=UPI00087C02C0|nr:LytTR family DNA-binding domain-containing protein [Afipia sp. GAS231]SDN77482.1 transcriptional regulator, LytTR family [Afipia sp. GAS231]
MNQSNGRIEPHPHNGVERAWDDRARFGDERSNDVTDGSQKRTTSRSITAYGWVALLIVAAGIVNVLSMAKDVTLSGGAGLLRPLLLEVTSATAWIAYLPLVRYGVAQFRWNRNRPTALAVALVATLLYAFLHLVTMVLLRELVFGLVAGGYAFRWVVEFPYEFRKDVISTLMIAVLFWLMERRASTSAGTPAANSVEPSSTALKQGLWLRDGPTSFHIDPQDIISVTSAGNYVEFNLSVGRRLIRGTLAAEETRLKPFGLIRVHRTRLANLNHVVAVEMRAAGDFLLRMDNGDTIAGSRRYREAAMLIKNHAASLDSASIDHNISHPPSGRSG